MFEKINKPIRMYREVADKIEEAIASGKLKPGDKLPNERDLAKSLGISQRTLREALRVLEEKGLLETCQTGNTIRMITTDVISNNLNLLIKMKKISWKEMFQFRLDLDMLITGRAARLATEEDLKKLQGIIDQVEDKFNQGELDWKHFHEFDQQLHLNISRIVGNPLHEWVLRTVLDNFSQYYTKFQANEDKFIKANLVTFNQLLAALENKDEEVAREASKEHLIVSARHLDELGLIEI